MKRVIATILLLPFLLSGCSMLGGTKTTTIQSQDAGGNPVTVTTEEPGSILGPSDYDTHGQMYGKFVDGKSAMVQAVAGAPLTAKTDEGKGYEAGMKYMAIQTIASQQFGVAAPVTFMGVLKDAVGIVPAVMTIKGFTDIGTMLAKTPRNVNIENSTVSDSLNTTDQTQISTGSSVPNQQGTQPTQDPVIVEPSYPPTE